MILRFFHAAAFLLAMTVRGEEFFNGKNDPGESPLGEPEVPSGGGSGPGNGLGVGGNMDGDGFTVGGEFDGDDQAFNFPDGGDEDDILANFGGDFGGSGEGGFGDFGGGFDDPSSGGNPFGGGGETDDFAAALGGFGADMMAMMFGQCLKNIDMEKMATDPFADVNNRCSDQQATTFNNALTSFETCAGFDLRALIENFASMFVGIMMNCGSYSVTVSNELDAIDMGAADMEQLKTKESPLPRVPQECVNTLVGDNPFGQAFLYSGEFPEREQTCFSELSGKLPLCTLDEWPIPIVGNWLSAFSCIYGSAQDVIMPMVQETLTGEIQMLNECIPEEITKDKCKDIRTRCIFDNVSPSVSMLIPPPFWNPPMAQRCKDAATSSGLSDVVDRYEAFRQTCIPAADLAIWDIAASHQDKHSDKEGGGASYMDAAAEEDPSTSSVFTPISEDTPISTIFAYGLGVGMVVAFVVMFGISRMRRKHRQRPLEDDFNSLELAESADFT